MEVAGSVGASVESAVMVGVSIIDLLLVLGFDYLLLWLDQLQRSGWLY